MLGVVSVGLVAVTSNYLIRKLQVHDLTLGAGDTSGESYVLSQAIATVIERYYPRIHITIQETVTIQGLTEERGFKGSP